MSDIFKIKIVKVPGGPAPEEIRRQWVGLEIDYATFLKGDEVDFLTGQKPTKRKGICVPKLAAIDALQKKSRQAAEWFMKNMPSGMEHLTFGKDEVEIIKES